MIHLYNYDILLSKTLQIYFLSFTLKITNSLNIQFSICLVVPPVAKRFNFVVLTIGISTTKCRRNFLAVISIAVCRLVRTTCFWWSFTNDVRNKGVGGAWQKFHFNFINYKKSVDRRYGGECHHFLNIKFSRMFLSVLHSIGFSENVISFNSYFTMHLLRLKT